MTRAASMMHLAERTRRRGRGLGVLLAALVANCGTQASSPVDVLASYTAALRDQRFTDAYRLLSADARRAVSYDEFERIGRERPEEIRETIRWLQQVDPTAPITARMELPSGDTITLVQEHGGWRLDPSALEFYGQHTPRQAVRSFVRALERRRFDVLLRFVPHHLAQGMTADSLRHAWETPPESESVPRMLSELQRSLDYPIEVVGDRATLQYGVARRFVALLVREDGAWKIEDPGFQ